MLRVTIAACAVAISVAACGGSEPSDRPLDTRAAKVFEQGSPSPDVVARSNDSKFDAFRALCKKQRAAADAFNAYMKSINRSPKTPEEAAEVERLMSELRPLDDELASWLERPEFDDRDKEAMRFIHAGGGN
jgi:hypothetical protein